MCLSSQEHSTRLSKTRKAGSFFHVSCCQLHSDSILCHQIKQQKLFKRTQSRPYPLPVPQCKSLLKSYCRPSDWLRRCSWSQTQKYHVLSTMKWAQLLLMGTTILTASKHVIAQEIICNATGITDNCYYECGCRCSGNYYGVNCDGGANCDNLMACYDECECNIVPPDVYVDWNHVDTKRNLEIFETPRRAK
jgi:hypothetical protein